MGRGGEVPGIAERSAASRELLGALSISVKGERRRPRRSLS